MPKAQIEKVEWAELTAVDKTIIAASPMVQGHMEVPHRIVIRDLDNQYVVHAQIFDGKQKPYFYSGNYFPKTNDSAPIAHPPCEALAKAWTCFVERACRTLQVPSPQSKVDSVADIAEEIINQLMGDDEEHRRDEFENDYQLDSNVETFENLTGKKIRPTHTSS